MDNNKELNDLKIVLKSLVLSCPERVTIHRLNTDYRKSEGDDIPYEKHGAETLEIFLKTITDTLRVHFLC